MQRVFLGIGLWAGLALAGPITLYNNLTPNNSIGVASRPDTAPSEIEAADDFALTKESLITGASFTGLMVPGTGGTPAISQVVLEIYRIFPLDSNIARTPNVPTRSNSPSDVAFTSADSASAGVLFSSTVLAASFSTLNSVQPGGIHPSPGQTTNGNGTLTGSEVQIDATLATPFDLPAGHYFFVAQVLLTNGGQFYWLSASRPISGAGTTSFPVGVTDLQAWTRDAALDPDWLRVGTDIVGGTTPPTFNLAFSLTGVELPEPSTLAIIGCGLVAMGIWRNRRKK